MRVFERKPTLMLRLRKFKNENDLAVKWMQEVNQSQVLKLFSVLGSEPQESAAMLMMRQPYCLLISTLPLFLSRVNTKLECIA